MRTIQGCDSMKDSRLLIYLFISFRLHNLIDLLEAASETIEDGGDVVFVHFDQGTSVCLFFFYQHCVSLFKGSDVDF